VKSMQELAAERGRSKRSLRPEVLLIAGFAGHTSAWRERRRDNNNAKPISDPVVANTTINATENDATRRLRRLLHEQRDERAAYKANNEAHRKKPLNSASYSSGSRIRGDDGWETCVELAALIFRPAEWMHSENHDTEDLTQSSRRKTRGRPKGEGGVVDLF
jgi:hypothetical protein